MLTLLMEEPAQLYFEQFRRTYYPAHRNKVPAHLSLFYRLALPGARLSELLEQHCQFQAPFPLRVAGLQLQSGNGLAFSLDSPVLQEWHAQLQEALKSELSIPRDRLPLQPHITILAGRTAFKAQRLQQQLSKHFMPFSVTARGVCVWSCTRDRWIELACFAFGGA